MLPNRVGRLVFLMTLGVALGLGGHGPAKAGAVTGPQMAVARQFHRATKLGDGRVLITGGLPGLLGYEPTTSIVELFDPETDTLVRVGDLEDSRYGHTATLLEDGRVLVCGGLTGSYLGSNSWLDTAEIYDPAEGTFHTVAARMVSSRYHHTATLLADGRVLLAGGTTTGDGAVAVAEIFDPETETFTADDAMVHGRAVHGAVLLADGETVLLAGGSDFNTIWAEAELWTSGGGFVPTGSLSVPRSWLDGELLPDGRVLLSGGTAFGSYETWRTIELYDPGTGLMSGDPGVRLSVPRALHANVVLPSGRVLLTGGDHDPSGTSTDSTDIFDPAGDTVTAGPSMTVERTAHTITLLDDGRVFLAGGRGSAYVTLASTEFLSPEDLGEVNPGRVKVRNGLLKDSEKRRKDFIRINGTLEAPEGEPFLDPEEEDLSLEIGPVDAPLGILIPAGDRGWKASTNQLSWKSTKGKDGKIQLKFNLKKGSFQVKASGIDWDEPPVNPVGIAVTTPRWSAHAEEEWREIGTGQLKFP